MMEELSAIGNKMAREFIETNQDVFVMVAEVDGKEVTVSVKFAPPPKMITREGVWNMLAERVSNQRLT
jgi:sRNA-binding carbon storage regulator CsrA